MSKKFTRAMFEVLKESARTACPVLPVQKLEEFTCGKLTGIAVGTALVFKRLAEAGYLVDSQMEELDCLLSNRDVEAVRQERIYQQELQENMTALEEGIKPETQE